MRENLNEKTGLEIEPNVMWSKEVNGETKTKVVSELEKMDLEQLKEIILTAEQIAKDKLFENFIEEL